MITIEEIWLKMKDIPPYLRKQYLITCFSDVTKTNIFLHMLLQRQTIQLVTKAAYLLSAMEKHWATCLYNDNQIVLFDKLFYVNDRINIQYSFIKNSS